MKLFELHQLKESITFGVAELEHDEHGKIFSGAKWWKKVEADCWVCDGTGHEPSPHEKYKCDMCNGSGKLMQTQSESPELNVANSNAEAILDFLGIDFDHVGNIPEDRLPEIRRKLIRLKNGGTDALASDTEISQSPMSARKGEDGVTRIGRGPKVIAAGRSEEQVKRYADKLLDIIDFAQKNNAHVTWN